MVAVRSTPGKPGRPRDPDIELRALGAAFAVYADRGWAGFTFEEVARRAGVGKSSIYRRWSTKVELLLDCIRLRQKEIQVLDTGSIQGDLIALATSSLQNLWGDGGVVSLRLLVESRFYPDLSQGLGDALHSEQLRASRAIVRRAIARNELPKGSSAALITDLVVGACLTHVLSTPGHLRAEAEGKFPLFVGRMVDVVIEGARQAGR